MDSSEIQIPKSTDMYTERDRNKWQWTDCQNTRAGNNMETTSNRKHSHTVAKMCTKKKNAKGMLALPLNGMLALPPCSAYIPEQNVNSLA